jgi:hypothetical protein
LLAVAAAVLPAAAAGAATPAAPSPAIAYNGHAGLGQNIFDDPFFFDVN